MIFDFDKIKFGKRIKELRVAQGLSQDDLCNKVEGLEPSYLSKIETGKYAPALPTFFKIINAVFIKTSSSKFLFFKFDCKKHQLVHKFFSLIHQDNF